MQATTELHQVSGPNETDDVLDDGAWLNSKLAGTSLR
jgi:hypothetical protein